MFIEFFESVHIFSCILYDAAPLCDAQNYAKILHYLVIGSVDKVHEIERWPTDRRERQQSLPYNDKNQQNTFQISMTFVDRSKTKPHISRSARQLPAVSTNNNNVVPTDAQTNDSRLSPALTS